MYNPMLNRTHYLNERLFAFGPLKNLIAGISLTFPRLKLIASYLTFDDGTGRRKYALKGRIAVYCPLSALTFRFIFITLKKDSILKGIRRCFFWYLQELTTQMALKPSK